MEPIGKLFGNKAAPRKHAPRSERDDLFDQILARLNPSRTRAGYGPITHARLGKMLKGRKDLYRLISVCNDAERRGYEWGAIFWTEITPRKPTCPNKNSPSTKLDLTFEYEPAHGVPS